MADLSVLEGLIQALRCLPGVGVKSASRMAYHLLQHDREGAELLSQALHQAAAAVQHCERCYTFTTQAVCETCLDESRDTTRLCVVETPADQSAVERTAAYKGLYFVLMGRLSPLDGVGARELPLERLIRRAQELSCEVLLATNFTVEGEATAHYLATLLRAQGVKVSRIARGLPVGGELEHVDSGTLAQAVLERRMVTE